jgi:P-type E1-E2 ATPase
VAGHRRPLVHELQAQGKVVAVVGDGINDAAAMAEASVGVAVSRGADMARETAQVVLATATRSSRPSAPPLTLPRRQGR